MSAAADPLGRPPHPSTTTGRRAGWALPVLLVVGVLVGYGLPFLGFWLSVAVPVVVHLARRRLWGAAAPAHPLVAALVWAGLWLPALSYSLTGWYWAVARHDLSTAWLLLPLCGPDRVAGLVVPALVATAVFAAGLVVSVRRRRPWVLVAGAWLAPWSHELALVAVGSPIIC